MLNSIKCLVKGNITRKDLHVQSRGIRISCIFQNNSSDSSSSDSTSSDDSDSNGSIDVGKEIDIENASSDEIQQTASTLTTKESLKDGEFPALFLIKNRPPHKIWENRNVFHFKEPREKKMSDKQDWGSVWPAPRSFHPAVVPLPLTMGVYPKTKRPFKKNANAELMKIPNFLHLTPPVIERQCAAIKKFCTKWPDSLKTEEEQRKHFPIEYNKSTYLYAGPSIRHERARVVSIEFSIDSLDLDHHGKDKLLRLTYDFFNPETRKIKLVSDRCPLSSQNKDYLFYILKLLYKESANTRPWEHEKTLQDMEEFVYEGSPSETNAKLVRKDLSEDDVKGHKYAVSKLLNEDENEENLETYKESVKKLYNL